MSVRTDELECCHGVGHQSDVHGCDGCCQKIFGDTSENNWPSKEQEIWFQAGVTGERERIRANIISRVSDLNACSKRDNCKELARLIESYIPEWLEEENK